MKGEIDPPYLKLHNIELIEPFARKADVSDTGRSARGFLAAYKLASGEPAMLGRNPTSGHLWADDRTLLINRHYAQARQNREKFWKDGLPTRRHLMLMMWAFTPTPELTAKWIGSLRIALQSQATRGREPQMR
jgi:hypothetical protein